MREILFRAKDEYGRWVFGSYVHSETHFPNDDKDFIIPRKVIGNSDFSQIPIEMETLGQFTGLTDKNGKKIFEGDIIQDGYNENNWVVRFFDAMFWGVDARGMYSDEELAELADLIPDGFQGVEVIGNIHDNPELLEEPTP